MSRNKNRKQRENMNNRIDQNKLEALELRMMADGENGLNDQLESIFKSVTAVVSVTLNQSEINFNNNQNPTETLLNLVKGNLSNLDLSDLESLTVDNIAQKINGIEGFSAVASSNMLTVSGEQNASFGIEIPTTENNFRRLVSAMLVERRVCVAGVLGGCPPRRGGDGRRDGPCRTLCSMVSVHRGCNQGEASPFF